MDDLNWQNRSIDWRLGWKYGQGDTSISEKLESDDFKDGYRYALDHPFGSCYSVRATTGK